MGFHPDMIVERCSDKAQKVEHGLNTADIILTFGLVLVGLALGRSWHYGGLTFCRHQRVSSTVCSMLFFGGGSGVGDFSTLSLC